MVYKKLYSLKDSKMDKKKL